MGRSYDAAMIALPLETQRLRLELPNLSSAQDLADHLDFIRQERVARMLATVPHPYPDDELPKRYALWHQAYDQDEDNLVFIIRERSSGRLVGSCGFQLLENRTQMEPGYVFAPAVWGQGYATEVLIALITEGLNAYPSVTQVSCPHFADNPASGRVMKKAGLKFWYEDRHACAARGPGKYPAKVLSLPDDSPLWPQNR